MERELALRGMQLTFQRTPGRLLSILEESLSQALQKGKRSWASTVRDQIFALSLIYELSET